MKKGRRIIVKLYCASAWKMVEVVGWEEERVDLGAIARAFELDPVTVKLNGHFISRGVDLVASSVTWNSLLSFFSSRGFPAGDSDSGAIVVDGKLSKLGSKRAHEPDIVDGRNFITKEHSSRCVNGRLQVEVPELLNAKRLKNSYSGGNDTKNEIMSLSLKRKLLTDGEHTLKRTRIDKNDPVPLRSTGELPGTVPSSQLPCSFISENAKRMREDEILLTSPCKRIR